MSTETLSFQTEAKKLLHLMINSLYSNREVFLRELISNASDAVDKLRFEALENDELLGEDTELGIAIDFDEEAATITVADNGIGMTRDEIIENLGTIAKSGTEEFLKQLTGDKKADATLIGQFGVGFYSTFMVSDEVEVLTRRAGTDVGTKWTSSGEEGFTVEDAEASRGTSVTLKLKEDAKEYLSSYRLREIVRRYSDHIACPVTMQSLDKDKQDERDTVNTATALWSRSRSDISEDEYKEFYKHISHDFEDPIAWSHNRVEGRLEYTSLLYIPKRAPFDLYNPDAERGLKLYVQRVFILDDAETFLPMYLRWVKGVVDSNDLPLNVSREMLQEHKAVETIRNALARRVLDRLQKVATDEPDAYGEFWDHFGNVLKEGTVPMNPNRETLIKLLRFTSTQDSVSSGEEHAPQRISLKDYIERAPEDQEFIYFVVGDNEQSARNSPHLEVFLSQGIEVLVFGDPIDAWMMSHLDEFEGKKFQDITRSSLDLPENKEEEEETAERYGDVDEPLLERIKAVLGDEVESVRKSKRLVDSPACLVLGEHDLDLHMRRVLEASGQKVPRSKPSLEINSTHSLVEHLSQEQDEARFEDLVHLLHEQAVLADGTYPIEAGTHVKRVNRLLTELLA
ncbi:MAG: molecular chaperone HtpG [Gammaproteobacteria bacterium]|nr:molecular chaperone HtpG [Gammaproteobacteria bacterium]MYF38780.1 molecular chaperone HtpG [Gammaproteobacteria bacterium]